MRQLQHHFRTCIPHQQPRPDPIINPGHESPKTDLQFHVRSFFVMVDLPLTTLLMLVLRLGAITLCPLSPDRFL